MRVDKIKWPIALVFSVALLVGASMTPISAQFCSSWPCNSCNGYSCVASCACQQHFAGITWCWDCMNMYATNADCEIDDGMDETGFCPYTCGTGHDSFCYP